MLPVVNNIITPVPIQPTLVSTPLPGNQTLRVLPDTVPPPISNVQINNNARGNSGGYVLEGEAAPVVTAESADEIILPAAQSNVAGRNGFGAPATFFAQLLSQDLPIDVQNALTGVLVEYEKLVTLPYVKYKPSNATLPQPAPSSVFGKLVQEQRLQAPEPVRAETPEPAQTTQAAANNNEILLDIPTPKPATGTQSVAAPETAAQSETAAETFSLPVQPVTPAPAVIRAYSAVQNALPKVVATEPA